MITLAVWCVSHESSSATLIMSKPLQALRAVGMAWPCLAAPSVDSTTCLQANEGMAAGSGEGLLAGVRLWRPDVEQGRRQRAGQHRD